MKLKELIESLKALPISALDKDVNVRVFQNGTTCDWTGNGVTLEPMYIDGDLVLDLYDTAVEDCCPVNKWEK